MYYSEDETETGDLNSNMNSEVSEAKEYTVNIDESVVYWKESMIGVYSYEGTLDFTKGSLKIKNGQ